MPCTFSRLGHSLQVLWSLMELRDCAGSNAKISSTVFCVRAFGPQVVALFGEVMLLLGQEASLEEAHHCIRRSSWRKHITISGGLPGQITSLHQEAFLEEAYHYIRGPSWRKHIIAFGPGEFIACPISSSLSQLLMCDFSACL